MFEQLTGSAQDGRSSGLTAPNGPSQATLLRTALQAAGAEPSAVSCISVHGTGTPLGDPIEIGALGQGLGSMTPRPPVTVLSNKSNFGHTEGAAGGHSRRQSISGLYVAHKEPFDLSHAVCGEL